MTTTKEDRPDIGIGPVQEASASKLDGDQNTLPGLKTLTEDERQFVTDLAELQCAIWTGNPSTTKEFRRPSGWQQSHWTPGQLEYLTFNPGQCLCANMGGAVVVIDVDPRNGGDITTVET